VALEADWRLPVQPLMQPLKIDQSSLLLQAALASDGGFAAASAGGRDCRPHCRTGPVGPLGL
jgi:hypothetical protein